MEKESARIDPLGRHPASPRHPVRLAITGSAGVGKTTLAGRLAAELNVPLLPEGMRERIENGLDLHILGRDGLRNLVRKLFEERRLAMEKALAAKSGFVADRSALDYLAFWLYYGFGADTAATAELFEQSTRAAKWCDLVVVLPWAALPLTSDGIRSANPWLQLHYQALLEGLLYRTVAPNRLALLPADIVGLDDRAAWVCARLRQTQHG